MSLSVNSPLLQVRLEREKRRRARARIAALPYQAWLVHHFPEYVTAPLAPRHERFWDWIESLEPGVRPPPRVEVWPRGGAKSTTVELGCARLGSQAEPKRHYVLYVSQTQAQADKHVSSIASMLEAAGVGRATNEYGFSRGWRREEIRTSTGFNVTAFGLDSGMRGVKLDQFRPDVIVFDDIDDRYDSVATVEKKIGVITSTVLPAGSSDAAIIFVQNKVHHASVVSQLCDNRADFLHDRLTATVEPAVYDLSYETLHGPDKTAYRVTGGIPSWEGQNLQVVEQQINTWGLGAFLREAQHEVDETEGGLWQRERDIAPFRVSKYPHLIRIVVAVDPSATTGGDACGIVVAGVDARKHAYVLADRTIQGSPKTWAEESVAAFHVFGADKLIAESNNGGEMVATTIGTVPGAPKVHLIHASRGKLPRAEPAQKLYQDGMVHHVGTFVELEKELVQWRPGMDSPNRLDALVWAITELLVSPGPSRRLGSI